MRGGPSPSVVEPCLLGSLGPKALQRGVRTSRRRPSTAIELFHLGRQVGSKFAVFRNLFAFFLHDAWKLRFLPFPDCFFMDFGMFGEGSGGVLEVVFHTIFKKIDVLKNSVFPREN